MATTDTTARALDAWRLGRFLELGFSLAEATQLAYTRNLEGWFPDVHAAARLLAAGATHSQVVRILR